MPKKHYIDLTQTLNPGIPDWEGCCGFKIDEQFFEEEGILVHSLNTPCGIGTHMDAPCHFIKNAADIASIDLNQLIAPAVVIDIRKRVKPDYFLSVAEIIDFEDQHGQIPEQSVVLLLTGWSQYWNDPIRYRNVHAEKGVRVFPGFSAEVAQYLINKNILGIGIDTLSPDGCNQSFPVHKIILGAGKYILENLCHLEQLPPIGSTIIALPLKIQGGSEAPTRVIAERIF